MVGFFGCFAQSGVQTKKAKEKIFPQQIAPQKTLLIETVIEENKVISAEKFDSEGQH